MTYLEFMGNFNLSGECVQVCHTSITNREEWVYTHFFNHAKKCSKYYAKKHGMTENECTCYIASGMYNKFITLRNKTIKKCGYHFDAMEVCCYYRVMSQLKIALQKMNLVTTSEYKTLKAWATPETIIGIAREDGLKKYVIPIIDHKETSKPEFIPTVSNSKMFDIVDLIEVWDNRHSRTESRLYDAMNELNSEVGNKTFFKPSEVDKLSEEDKRRLNKKLYALARYNNMLSRMTQLNGNYSNPCDIYCHNETIQEARKKLSSDKHFEDVLLLASSNDNLSEKNKKVIQRFRDRHNLYYNVYDDKGNIVKHEMMTRDNLIYLCK